MIRFILKIFLSSFIICGSFVACTTSESEDDSTVENELNAELDDMEESAASADDGLDDDFDDESFADSGGKEKDSGGDDISDDDFADFDSNSSDSDDDDFFAEDADAPKDTQDLAEKDLQKELEKSNDSVPSGENTIAEGEPNIAQEPVAAESKNPTIASQPSVGLEESFENISPPPTQELPKEDLGISDPLVADVDPPLPAAKAAKEVVPVPKINREPFFRNQRLMNTVYIARPGDDLMSISQKVYEKDNTQVLLADNPYLVKGIDVGDQIFYTSPNRPEDKKEILTYYEDVKMPAQHYITKQGDNIQKIGREVLGYDEAWKEIWAENDILQTQALLPSGLKIRYWSGNELQIPPEAPATIGAMGSASDKGGTPPPTAPETPETLMDVNSGVASSTAEDPGLTMSETPAVAPLPSDITPPVPVATPAQVSDDANNSLLTIAGVSLIGLAVLALIAIQIKNRKKESPGIPPSLEFTKV